MMPTPTTEKFRVIYLWRGERHALLETFNYLEDARKAVGELKKKKFTAWYEVIVK